MRRSLLIVCYINKYNSCIMFLSKIYGLGCHFGGYFFNFDQIFLVKQMPDSFYYFLCEIIV